MDPLADALPAVAHFARLQGAQLSLILGLMMFLGTWGGRLFERLRIPQVVGYFVVGIALGNSGLQIMRPDVVAALNPISSIALAFIGFLVGGELKISVIKKYGRQFTSVLLFEALTPALVVFAATSLVEYFFSRNFYVSVSFGLLLGAICASTAPSATTNVLQEYRCRGPLTTMVYGVVAMDDAVALILFAVASTIAAPLLGGHPAPLSRQLLLIARNIFGSMAFGLAPGALIALIIKKQMGNEGRALSFMLGILLVSTGVCSLLGLDTILAAMSIGFFIANFAPKSEQPIFKITNNFTPPIYVLFFVTVGAKLDIWKMRPALIALVAAYVAGRTFGKSLGSWFGAKITSAPRSVQKYMKYCLLSQAGVAIGLSLQAGNVFSDTIGNSILLVVTTTTFIVELIGPVFVKIGVTKAGETGMDVTEDDIIRRTRARDLTWGHERICDKSSPSIARETDRIGVILGRFETHHNQTFAVAGADGKLSGVITLEHLKESLQIGEMADNMLAMDIMDKPSLVCSPDTPLPEIYEKLSETDGEALPIVGEDGAPLGMVEKFAADHYVHAKILETRRKLKSMG